MIETALDALGPQATEAAFYQRLGSAPPGDSELAADDPGFKSTRDAYFAGDEITAGFVMRFVRDWNYSTDDIDEAIRLHYAER
jgi:hypothetical protein